MPGSRNPNTQYKMIPIGGQCKLGMTNTRNRRTDRYMKEKERRVQKVNANSHNVKFSPTLTRMLYNQTSANGHNVK